jgi:hypothetical protein
VHVVSPSGAVLWEAFATANLLVTSAAFDPQGRLTLAGVVGETDFLGGHYVPRGPSDAFVMQFQP